MPTVEELLERESFFDAAVLRHGFVDYMRDYEIIVAGRGGPSNEGVYRYHFVGCVEAQCRSALRPDTLAISLSDNHIFSGPEHPDRDVPDGFIWGIRESVAYPGLTYVKDSSRAHEWSQLLQRPMHEIRLETNAFELSLVFADVRVELVPEGEKASRPLKDMPIMPKPHNSSNGGVQ